MTTAFELDPIGVTHTRYTDRPTAPVQTALNPSEQGTVAVPGQSMRRVGTNPMRSSRSSGSTFASGSQRGKGMHGVGALDVAPEAARHLAEGDARVNQAVAAACRQSERRRGGEAQPGSPPHVRLVVLRRALRSLRSWTLSPFTGGPLESLV